MFGEDHVNFTEGWSGGCSDMGNVSCVMPILHPQMGGAEGNAHSIDFRIVDPVRACVDSAKVQCAALVRLLENDAAAAKRILAEGRHDYPSIKDYLASLDQLAVDKEAVIYHEDGTVTLDV